MTLLSHNRLNKVLGAVCLLAACVFTSCSQDPHLEIPSGIVTQIKQGTIVKIREVNMKSSDADEGAFAAVAGGAVGAITPGIISQGTSKIASGAGSLMDGRVEADKMLRVRIKLDGKDGHLVEVLQKVSPKISLKVGQKVIITTGSTPGNVWPD